MYIRHSTPDDLPRMVDIYRYARQFMADHGNPRQWGGRNWPPESLLRQDIRDGHSYVCCNDTGAVIGTFFFLFGDSIEPTYHVITDGHWRGDERYGVVHRLAGDGSEKGIGAYCLRWAIDQSQGHLRVDTHGDNVVMQNLLGKLGFLPCGTIYVVEDSDPRIAYEKLP